MLSNTSADLFTTEFYDVVSMCFDCLQQLLVYSISIAQCLFEES